MPITFRSKWCFIKTTFHIWIELYTDAVWLAAVDRHPHLLHVQTDQLRAFSRSRPGAILIISVCSANPFISYVWRWSAQGLHWRQNKTRLLVCFRQFSSIKDNVLIMQFEASKVARRILVIVLGLRGFMSLDQPVSDGVLSKRLVRCCTRLLCFLFYSTFLTSWCTIYCWDLVLLRLSGSQLHVFITDYIHRCLAVVFGGNNWPTSNMKHVGYILPGLTHLTQVTTSH